MSAEGIFFALTTASNRATGTLSEVTRASMGQVPTICYFLKAHKPYQRCLLCLTRAAFHSLTDWVSSWTLSWYHVMTECVFYCLLKLAKS